MHFFNVVVINLNDVALTIGVNGFSTE
ncbi:hypothetical protein RB2150_10459 [Rhodobacterales bacterium HTCC2150]|nr:hypothetical protein RB2150_10459 [Rhodobacterales bacterium HTCC2150] [Rhodobacteraceae bacterium HTCC2150]